MKKIRIGMIGTGLIARYHAQAIGANSDRCEIAAICDTDPEKMEAYAKDLELGEIARYTDYHRLLEHEGLDMVSVCTANDSHCEITMAAARAGIPVLCEKPLGLNAGEVRQMADACESAGVINMTGFTYRRIPALEQIKALIDRGELGRIYHYKGRFYADRMAAPDHPLEWRHLEERAGSGVLGDLASHILDMALYLLEGQSKKIRDVYADASIIYPVRKDPRTGEEVTVTSDDVCNIIAHFEDGTEVILENSRYSPFEMEIHISGLKGSVKYNLSRYDEFELMLYDSPADYFKTFRTVPVAAPREKGKPAPADRMARQYRYMAECIREGRTAHPTIRETIYIQELLDVMKKSYKEQRKINLEAAEPETEGTRCM